MLARRLLGAAFGCLLEQIERQGRDVSRPPKMDCLTNVANGDTPSSARMKLQTIQEAARCASTGQALATLSEEIRRAVREEVRRDLADTGGPIEAEAEYRIASGRR